MSELERYGLAAVAVVIVAVLLISVNNPDPGSSVGLPEGSSRQAEPGSKSRALVIESAGLEKSRVPGKPSQNRGVGGGAKSSPGAVGPKRDIQSPGASERILTVISTDPASTGPKRQAPSGSTKQAPATPKKAQPLFVDHVVKKNENLSALASRYLGKASRWREIIEANPGLDPMKMRPGDTVRIPSAAVAKSGGAPAPKRSSKIKAQTPKNRLENQLAALSDVTNYTVRSGDTLQKISSRFYGTTKRWKRIFNFNRERLKRADAVRAGMVLQIPPSS